MLVLPIIMAFSIQRKMLAMKLLLSVLSLWPLMIICFIYIFVRRLFVIIDLDTLESSISGNDFTKNNWTWRTDCSMEGLQFSLKGTKFNCCPIRPPYSKDSRQVFKYDLSKKSFQLFSDKRFVSPKLDKIVSGFVIKINFLTTSLDFSDTKYIYFRLLSIPLLLILLFCCYFNFKDLRVFYFGTLFFLISWGYHFLLERDLAVMRIRRVVNEEMVKKNSKIEENMAWIMPQEFPEWIELRNLEEMGYEDEEEEVEEVGKNEILGKEMNKSTQAKEEDGDEADEDYEEGDDED